MLKCTMNISIVVQYEIFELHLSSSHLGCLSYTSRHLQGLYMMEDGNPNVQILHGLCNIPSLQLMKDEINMNAKKTNQ